jgi:hypothetical protein
MSIIHFLSCRDAELQHTGYVPITRPLGLTTCKSGTPIRHKGSHLIPSDHPIVPRMKSLKVYRTLPGEIPSPFQVKSSIYFYKAAVPTLANCSAPRVICALKAAFTRRYKEGDEPSPLKEGVTT